MHSAHPARLSVYNKALGLVMPLEDIAAAMPLAYAELQEQLRCAASSVVLNTAEGAGEFSPAEKARFYRMARRSATECLAILDIVARIRPDLHLGTAHNELEQVAGMLTTLVRSMESRRN